jgi:hypothetical protein
MSAKKFDLAKSLGLKIAGRMSAAGIPDRFGGAEQVDRREQRRRDAAAGLVPFACKLPGELTRELQQLAPSHEGGINGLVAELLAQALKKSAAAPADAEADEAAAPKAAKKTADKTAADKTAAAKKAAAPKEAEAPEPAAKKVAAKKTAAKKA